MLTGGQLIVESLVANGVDRLFCVPGESYLGLLDALYGRNDIDTIVCRHESGAGFMALADSRLTGRPGVVAVSRGPGASNAAIAIHSGEQEATPLVVLIGQVALRDLRRGAFQEIDYGRMFGSIAKFTAEVTDPAQIPEVMMRAFRIATTGVPGPVIVVVPEDVLTASADVVPASRQPDIAVAPSPEAARTLDAWLQAAARPLAIVGSGLDRPGGREALLRFAEERAVPIVTAFRRHDLFPNRHRLYAGDLGLSNAAVQMDAFRQADLVLVLGARLSDITTQGYTFPTPAKGVQRLVHVHRDSSVIGRQFATDLGIACHPRELLEMLGQASSPSARDPDWPSRLREIRESLAKPRGKSVDDGIPFDLVVETVGRHLAPDAIVTVDAGAFGAPVYRLVPFQTSQRLLAPISGAMGYGVPTAVAAALRQPSRQVVCFVGDGGFLMTGAELSVVMEHKLAIKVIVAENRIYGSIRQHQERGYPGRVVGTIFTNPDLMMIGKAYGFRTHHITRSEQLSDLPSILASDQPEFVVVETSVQAIL